MQLKEIISAELTSVKDFIIKAIQRKYGDTKPNIYSRRNVIELTYRNIKMNDNWINNIKKMIEDKNKYITILVDTTEVEESIITITNPGKRVVPPRFLIHLTNIENIPTILRDGLIPKENRNIDYGYRPAIFFSTPDYLFYDNQEDYSILLIDTTKVDKRVRFFIDLNFTISNNGKCIMCFDQINPEAITEISNTDSIFELYNMKKPFNFSLMNSYIRTILNQSFGEKNVIFDDYLVSKWGAKIKIEGGDFNTIKDVMTQIEYSINTQKTSHFKVFFDISPTLRHITMVYIQYKFYGEPINRSSIKYKYLYHVTRRDNVSNILENGLIPRASKDSEEWGSHLNLSYDSAIFFTTNLMYLFRKEKSYMDVVVVVELSQLPDDIIFYRDTNLENVYGEESKVRHIFTYSRIEPKYIEILTKR